MGTIQLLHPFFCTVSQPWVQKPNVNSPDRKFEKMAAGGCVPVAAAEPRIMRGLLEGASSRKSSCSHAGQALAPCATVLGRVWLIPHTESCSIDLDLVNLTSKQRSSRPHQTRRLCNCPDIHWNASCDRNHGVFSSPVPPKAEVVRFRGCGHLVPLPQDFRQKMTPHPIAHKGPPPCMAKVSIGLVCRGHPCP